MTRREEAPTDDPPIRLVRTVFLLRHGQHAPDAPDNLGGGLTALGRRQVRRAARRVAEPDSGRTGFRTHTIPVLQQPAKSRTAIPTGFLQ